MHQQAKHDLKIHKTDLSPQRVQRFPPIPDPRSSSHSHSSITEQLTLVAPVAAEKCRARPIKTEINPNCCSIWNTRTHILVVYTHVCTYVGLFMAANHHHTHWHSIGLYLLLICTIEIFFSTSLFIAHREKFCDSLDTIVWFICLKTIL